MADHNKVVKFKKRKSINIGIVIFLMLFIYIAINVYIFFTKEQLIIYEVHEGTTAIDNKITALILREEKLITSAQGGYVLYYQMDGARVAKNESIYSMSDSEIYNARNSEDAPIKLSDNNDAVIRHEVRSYRNSYTNDDFYQVYSFKDTAESEVLNMLNNSLVIHDQEKLEGAGVVASDESGIITYYMDNFETVTPDQVTKDMFQRDRYKKTSLRTTEKISPNTPVYKMITSETWNMVLPLTKEQYQRLEEKDKVKITVLEDDYTMTAPMERREINSDYYAVLTMDKDMANYLGERYLEVSIEFDSSKGLKIPSTAIVEKDFYEVPISFLSQGGESKDKGLTVEEYGENGEIIYRFVATEIYYQNEDYGYVDASKFKAGTVIQLPGEAEKYTLSKLQKFQGVYNVNLGYAVFRKIEILQPGEEYTIINDHTSNGLSAYDHIVLDGKLAEEQKIIY